MMRFSYLKKLTPKSSLFKGLASRVAAVPMFVLLSPFFAFGVAATALTIGRPFFVRQPRYGLHGKIFHIYKIRTMTDERDTHGELLPDDARRTRIGSILRATTIDEIPQILNVLKGEMAIIGPRPMEDDVSWLPLWKKRYDILPGLTGLVQIHTRPEGDMPHDLKRAYDLTYVRMKKRGGWQLFKLDACIIAHTLYVMATANHAPIGGPTRPRNGNGNGNGKPPSGPQH